MGFTLPSHNANWQTPGWRLPNLRLSTACTEAESTKVASEYATASPPRPANRRWLLLLLIEYTVRSSAVPHTNRDVPAALSQRTCFSPSRIVLLVPSVI